MSMKKKRKCKVESGPKLMPEAYHWTCVKVFFFSFYALVKGVFFFGNGNNFSS
jgi:hypothetical protein